MKKKILLAVLMLAMLVFVLAISVSAVEIDGIFYSLDTTNKTATLTGENVNCQLETVNIPETITVENVEYTVTELDEGAFSGAKPWLGNQKIKEVTIPKTVTHIGKHCFRNCLKVEKITVTGPAVFGGDAEFYNCTSLTTLDLSGMTELKVLGDYLCDGCTKLTEVLLPNSEITSIGHRAFASCAFTSFDIPSTVTSIGGFAFNSASNLTSIVIPDNVTSLGDYAFQSCTSLNSVKLPNSLTYLGKNNFQSSKITEIVIPATLTQIQNHVFHGSKLEKVVFASTGVTNFNTQAFDGANSLRVVFFAGADKASAEAFTSGKSKISGFTNFVSYADYLANPNATYTNTIVYGTENCSGCHDLSTKSQDTFLFEDYMSPMYDAKVCSSCQATTKGTEYAPMFSGYMISTPEDGRAAVCVTYSLNASSVAKYEEEMNTVISYGVIAAGKANLGNNAPLDENGNTTTLDKGVVIKAEMSKGYASYDFKITGAEALTEAVDVIIATYVTEGNGYVYLQNGVVNNLDFASITIQPNA